MNEMNGYVLYYKMNYVLIEFLVQCLKNLVLVE